MASLIKKLCLLPLIVSSSLIAVTWTYTEDTEGNDLISLGYPVPVAVDSMTAFHGFRRYESLHARHQELMIVSDYITGNIVGNTFNGRDIWAYSLSDPDNTTIEGLIPEGAVLQNGGIHAREWSTPEITTGIMERLAANENDHWIHQYLLENLNIIIQPVENVDGFIQTQNYPDTTLQTTFVEDPVEWPRDGRMRRKNMRDVDDDLSTLDDALLGIDLNRNNPSYWNTSASSSSNNQSLVFHGNSASSEPETLSLQASAELGPADRLRFYVDTHSFSQLWYMPNTGNSRRNNIATEVGHMMQAATNNRYELRPSAAGSGIGSTDDYFAVTHEIPSYTLETEPGNTGAVQYGGRGVSHDGFILPEAEINRVRNELADASIIAWYMQSGPAALIAVEITDTNTDAVVYAGNWDITSTSERTWVETINDVLNANGNYRIWAAYNKPMRWINEQQQVANFTATNIELAPEVRLEGLASNGQAFNQIISGNASSWLLTPGGAGQGYLNYKADAFMIDFTVSASITPSTSTLLALAFVNVDISGKTNDADPSTIVDWDTSWLNYENSDGDSTDTGGIDRTIRLINDNSAGFTDPATRVNNGDTSGDNNSNQSSGGGSFDWILLLIFILPLLRHSKYQH